MLKKFLCICYLMCFGLSVYANDAAGAVLPTGGVMFEKQDGIKMQVEALYIRPGQVEVSYLFKNTTDKDITTQVFFPLPDMPAVKVFPSWEEKTHEYEFALWVNGKPKQYQTHWTVKQNDRDITKDISILFYRPEEVITDQELDKRIQNLPEETRQKLQNEKIIEWGWLADWDKGEFQAWTMANDISWKKQIMYFWEQTFPAKQTISIRHQYTPSNLTSNTGQPYSKCLDKSSEQYDKFMHELPQGDTDFYFNDHLHAQKYLEYILTTANNWQGPIENFNLLVESPLKSVGCFDGEEFYGERFYAINRLNYTPKRDMSVDFVANKDIYPYRAKSEPVLYHIDGPANLRDNPNGKLTAQLADKTYVWGWPDEKQGKWYPVRQNELVGYTHEKNLIKVF